MTDATVPDMPDFLRRAAPAAPSAPPAREPRQRRQKKAAEAPPAPPKEKKARKPRAAKKAAKERAAPDTVKVTLKEYAAMRIAPAAKEFVKIHKIMSGVTGLGRAKLLAELQKVFG